MSNMHVLVGTGNGSTQEQAFAISNTQNPAYGCETTCSESLPLDSSIAILTPGLSTTTPPYISATGTDYLVGLKDVTDGTLSGQYRVNLSCGLKDFPSVLPV